MLCKSGIDARWECNDRATIARQATRPLIVPGRCLSLSLSDLCSCARVFSGKKSATRVDPVQPHVGFPSCTPVATLLPHDPGLLVSCQSDSPHTLRSFVAAPRPLLVPAIYLSTSAPSALFFSLPPARSSLPASAILLLNALCHQQSSSPVNVEGDRADVYCLFVWKWSIVIELLFRLFDHLVFVRTRPLATLQEGWLPPTSGIAATSALILESSNNSLMTWSVCTLFPQLFKSPATNL